MNKRQLNLVRPSPGLARPQWMSSSNLSGSPKTSAQTFVGKGLCHSLASSPAVHTRALALPSSERLHVVQIRASMMLPERS